MPMTVYIRTLRLDDRRLWARWFRHGGGAWGPWRLLPANTADGLDVAASRLAQKEN